ncbi:multidrug resistance-associated protein 1-like [Paramacrobiotus metropolitanus]|uniref:multidrug resistance-associated protein 1-like n=1 Tax=Paramacrobiotus metropolitanus TaxID=2943436 RepID=UPI002445ABEF|nr:multidrug resistance-associated protein 1-like [Paramacrobiotus metropolitanus]
MFRPSQNAVGSQELPSDTSALEGIYHPFPKNFCPDGDAFWNRSVTWDTENPDFTRCFQQTALVWIPCGFLWLMLPVQAYNVLSAKYKIKHWTWVSVAKTILTCALAILNLVDFFYIADVWRTSSVSYFTDVDLMVPLIKTATFILAALYIFFDRRAARPSSGILLIFWLLMLIEGIITFRYGIVQRINTGLSSPVQLQFITLVISFPIVVVQFVLSWFAEYFSVLLGDGKKPSPEPLASIPSWVTFSYFTTLAYKGWKKPLLQSDLWDLTEQDRTKKNVDRLHKFWDRELEKSKNRNDETYTVDAEVVPKKPYSASLGWALIRAFWAPASLAGFYRILQDLLLFVSPQVLRLLIDFIGDGSAEVWKGYFYAAIMLVAGTAQCFFVNHFFFKTSRVGLQIRGSIMAAVYRKALRITSSAKRSSNLGEIVNLMSVDAQRLNDLMVYVHLLWSAPFSIGLTIYFLYDVVGYSVFAGLAVLLMTIPSNYFLASRNKRIQLAQMKHKDARIKLTSEILNGMKVLKLYAWEESFEKQVLELRELELRQLQKAARLEAISAFNWFVTPFLMSFVTFATFVLSSSENVLDADKAFVALSLLNILRLPLTMLPHCVTLLVQSRVSLKRLTKFLCNDELNPNNVRSLPASDIKHALRIQNGTFSWGQEEPVCLKDINLDVAHGELLAVVGQVGSGKSSVVAAMLGLMEKLSGDVAVKGTVAYVPQQAWIQNLTLKENILFGKPLDEERYQKVLDACALRTDLELLAAGDQTEIGEKGTNLSGGQRQRVSLARAVYSDSDVYFLDDPLSAVDAHVGKHIFEHVIGPNGMLNNKTRILVTHGVGYLPQVDRIVVLGNKHISEVGTYDQLLQNNGVFAEFLRTYYLDELEAVEKNDPDAVSKKEEILTEISHVGGLQVPPYERQRSSSSLSTVSSMRTERTSSMRAERKVREVFRRASRVSLTNKKQENGTVLPEQKAKLLEEDDEDEGKGKLVESETAEFGQVKMKVFHTYFKNATYLAAFGMVGSYTLFNAFNVSGSFWLTEWTKDANYTDRRGDPGWRDYRLGVYFTFGFLQSIFILCSYLILAYGQIMASRNLHRGMLMRIMRAPMSFFDTTPLGRIVNRFSKDVEIVDSMIPLNMEGVIYCFLSVVFTLVVISISTPIFSPVIIPLAIFYFLVQRFYIASNRQLKRLEAISRSPIYSHFQESVQGSSVILAARQGERFIVENERRVDANNMSFFLNILSQRWVAIRMDCVGNLITFFAAVFAVLSKSLDMGADPENIGLSISYSLSVTQVMNWMVRNISDLESNVVSVERIKEYSEIPNEASWVIDGKRPPKDWPPAGRVRFENYQTRYRPELDLVLRGVDCDIQPGEKIGIVGRTGAGKSSLTLALFRIIEAAGGQIEIDAQNIGDMGLHDVRSRITILPQEPVLFSGSLRLNLDPFDKHNDEEIWSALEHSHLKTFVSALPDGLTHLVAEGGENLSVGQRQLICLARALLRKTKILVLDEATAAIDLETDALIQETIRDKFSDCTILTIAHRINTIMDSTRVMVLDQGRVKEFASPDDLLADPKSIFYSLAKSAGLAA